MRIICVFFLMFFMASLCNGQLELTEILSLEKPAQDYNLIKVWQDDLNNDGETEYFASYERNYFSEYVITQYNQQGELMHSFSDSLSDDWNYKKSFLFSYSDQAFLVIIQERYYDEYSPNSVKILIYNWVSNELVKCYNEEGMYYHDVHFDVLNSSPHLIILSSNYNVETYNIDLLLQALDLDSFQTVDSIISPFNFDWLYDLGQLHINITSTHKSIINNIDHLFINLFFSTGEDFICFRKQSNTILFSIYENNFMDLYQLGDSGLVFIPSSVPGYYLSLGYKTYGNSNLADSNDEEKWYIITKVTNSSPPTVHPTWNTYGYYVNWWGPSPSHYYYDFPLTFHWLTQFDETGGDSGFAYYMPIRDDNIIENKFVCWHPDLSGLRWVNTETYSQEDYIDISISACMYNIAYEPVMIYFFKEANTNRYEIRSLQTGSPTGIYNAPFEPHSVLQDTDNNIQFIQETENRIQFYTAEIHTNIDNQYNFSQKHTPTLSCYPNPFNPTTTISFELAQEAEVTLSVFNVKGQLVTKLINGELRESSSHSVVWNGKNDAGLSVGSGVYYYKLTAGDVEQVEKMVLMK